MLKPDALAAFTLAQKRLLVVTYNHAWQHGVANYTPTDRPYDPAAEASAQRDEALLTGLALLAARARRQYVPPTTPDGHRRAVALAPALHSVNAMTGELAGVVPSPADLAAAEAAVAAGSIEPAQMIGYAWMEAVSGWAGDNAWRLNGGDSAAWAGEQSGYAEAANAGGDLLEWESEGDDHVCVDCESLSQMDPMPLSEWPSTPGSGDTECNVGCRCSFSVAATMPSTDSYQSYPLSADQQATVDAILGRRDVALNGLMPDMALLS